MISGVNEVGAECRRSCNGMKGVLSVEEVVVAEAPISSDRGTQERCCCALVADDGVNGGM